MSGIEFNGSYPVTPEMADVMAELADKRGVAESDIYQQLSIVRQHLAETANSAIDTEQGGKNA